MQQLARAGEYLKQLPADALELDLPSLELARQLHLVALQVPSFASLERQLISVTGMIPWHTVWQRSKHDLQVMSPQLDHAHL